jgi:PAS domain S-box-containing protein
MRLFWKKWIASAEERRLTAAAERELHRRQEVEEELRRVNADLERRVEERTAAVREAHAALKAEMAEHTRTLDNMRVKDFALASSLNAIALADMDGRLTYVNPAFLDTWRMTREEAIGAPLTDILFSREAAQVLLATVREIGAWKGETKARRPTGEPFDAMVAASVVRDTRRLPVCIMAVFIETTARNRADAALRNRLRLEEMLAACSVTLLETPARPEHLQTVLTQLLRVSAASRVCIFENFNDPTDGLCARMTIEVCSPDVNRQVGNPRMQQLCFADHLRRWATELSQGRPLFGAVSQLPDCERPILDARGVVSYLLLPLFVAGRWHGFIEFDDTEHERVWPPEDVGLLGTIAGLIQSWEERRATMAALSQSEDRYRSLAEAAHDMIFIVGKDGRLEYVNRFAAEMFGRRPEQIVGCLTSDLFRGPAGEKQVASLCQVLDSGQPLYRETQTPFPAGEVWLDTWLTPLQGPDGRPRAVLGISRDSTARKRAEVAVADLARQWQTTFDAVGDAICLLDADHRIQRCNAAFSRLAGVPVADCIGRFCWELIHHSAVPVEDCPVIRAQRSLKREVSELKVGATLHEVVADPLTDAAGKYLGAVHILRDKTAHCCAAARRDRQDVPA